MDVLQELSVTCRTFFENSKHARCIVMPNHVSRGNLEALCRRLHVLSVCYLSSALYLQTMNGSAVARIVVFRPIVSIRGPPAIPPSKADSGIKLPIHDF